MGNDYLPITQTFAVGRKAAQEPAEPGITATFAGKLPVKEPIEAGSLSPKTIRLLYTLAKGINYNKTLDAIKDVSQETAKGTEALKDSVNSYMHRSTRPSDRLIEETIANHLRKFGK